MNVKSLSYELGVLMFNVAHGIQKDGYDAVGNFEGILLGLGANYNESKLLEGFVSEAYNWNIDSDEATEMFYDFFKNVNY